MFGLFKSPFFADPELGELHRSSGMWRGTLLLGEARVPLVLIGSRAVPDPRALDVARSISSSFWSWRPMVERALFEHYLPYAEAVSAGEAEPPESGLPAIAGPAAVWPHASAEFVQVIALGGQLTVEIGYRVAWDEEHTLGARLRDGQLVELCGSVLTS
jgi:hypothetical protein